MSDGDGVGGVGIRHDRIKGLLPTVRVPPVCVIFFFFFLSLLLPLPASPLHRRRIPQPLNWSFCSQLVNFHLIE